MACEASEACKPTQENSTGHCTDVVQSSGEEVFTVVLSDVEAQTDYWLCNTVALPFPACWRDSTMSSFHAASCCSGMLPEQGEVDVLRRTMSIVAGEARRSLA